MTTALLSLILGKSAPSLLIFLVLKNQKESKYYLAYVSRDNSTCTVKN